jgi:hypothetical protein
MSLTHRSVVKISGPDRLGFLQGLLTQDVTLLQKHPIYSLFLTPNGRFLTDLFLSQIGDDILVDCEKAYRDELLKKFSLYKLRSRVSLTPYDTMDIAFIIGKTEEDLRPFINDSLIYKDPRYPHLGLRIFHYKNFFMDTTDTFKHATLDFYHFHRIQHGIPEGSMDMTREKSIPLEFNMDHLNAISWTKGCYMGQELTARTHHQGLIRKRLLPFECQNSPIAMGVSLYQAGEKVGTITSHTHKRGLARIRMDAMEKQESITLSDNTVVELSIPQWLKIH